MSVQLYSDSKSKAWKKVLPSWLQRSPLKPFPRVVQIQTVTECNARCTFCPHPNVYPTVSHGKMERELFEKIAYECIVEKSCRSINLYLMNEPLVDKDLPTKIEFITRHRGHDQKLKTKINTNGALLNQSMGEALIEAKLDQMNISFHGISPESYEQSMGNLKFERTLAKVQEFLELKLKKGAKKPLVKVTMVATKIVEQEIEKLDKFWGQYGINVNVRPLTNRAANSVNTADISIRPMKPFTWCRRLYEQAYILYNGQTILCCNDWERATNFGNLQENTLREIWHNSQYKQMRRRFSKGDIKGTICENCYMEV